jgi:hypothetical protein
MEMQWQRCEPFICEPEHTGNPPDPQVRRARAAACEASSMGTIALEPSVVTFILTLQESRKISDEF